MQLSCFDHQKKDNAISLIPVNHKSLESLSNHLSQSQCDYIQACGFKANQKQFILLANDHGNIEFALWGVEGVSQLELLGYASRLLPNGSYQLIDWFSLVQTEFLAYLGFALGSYRFEKYTTKSDKKVTLFFPEALDQSILHQAEATYLVRDLVNIPANELGPKELADMACQIAKAFQANCEVIVGDDLLKENYPLIHAVGRASENKPRLIKLSWGNKNNPRVALVGKGVCFDSGGLSLKPSAGMKTMKKDMGGAAQTLGLAYLIMKYQLPVYLDVYIPAVENSVNGNAFRLGDVIKARNAKTVEILNTDAEGRLILADALVEASEKKADLIIDFATLTGACRVALGMEIGGLFSNDEKIAKAVVMQSEISEDLLWHLPLFKKYKKSLNSQFANMANIANSPYAGTIIAALFLEEFVNETPWIHVDFSAWHDSEQATSLAGGDAIGMRAIFNYLCSRFV